MITNEEWAIYTINRLKQAGKIMLVIGITLLLISLSIYLIKGNTANSSREGFVFYLTLIVEIFFNIGGIGCFISAFIYKNNLKVERR
jgi:hypothetical protein